MLLGVLEVDLGLLLVSDCLFVFYIISIMLRVVRTQLTVLSFGELSLVFGLVLLGFLPLLQDVSHVSRRPHNPSLTYRDCVMLGLLSLLLLLLGVLQLLLDVAELLLSLFGL
jgi:hypothetical protein